MTSAAAIAAASLLAASLANGQAQVVESQPILDNRSPGISGQTSPAQPSAGGSQAEVFYQLQQLQQEVLQLRGLVEEQSYELKRLKQQRMDDYLDLDRRLSSLSSGGASRPAPPAAKPAVTRPEPSSTEPAVLTPAARPAAAAPSQAPASSGNDLQDYRAAIDLVLYKRDYDRGEAMLLQHISNYPESKYKPNCQYWLGQIYLMKRDYEQAKQRFLTFKQQYPLHDKYMDALFKLGKAYHLLGDTANARPNLEQAAEDGGSVGKLARTYLDKHFR